ncbi:hypothetical protein LOAG_03998 [Loa loa]|uniref:Uncharacterized protein n=1 Tax=Loa loa TaxID=7209 RepID=A0A1S0U3B8_LOALO|nr:hypothetical protein LOAG_03998 [Loa loa]EFO24484.1 hypothetical protein LOAG_03998 [Loa loa]
MPAKHMSTTHPHKHTRTHTHTHTHAHIHTHTHTYTYIHTHTHTHTHYTHTHTHIHTHHHTNKLDDPQATTATAITQGKKGAVQLANVQPPPIIDRRVLGRQIFSATINTLSPTSLHLGWGHLPSAPLSGDCRPLLPGKHYGDGIVTCMHVGTGHTHTYTHIQTNLHVTNDGHIVEIQL